MRKFIDAIMGKLQFAPFLFCLPDFYLLKLPALPLLRSGAFIHTKIKFDF